MDTSEAEKARGKTLFVVRHCESEANRLGILASRRDFGLSETGRADAGVVAAAFAAQFPVERVVSSPLLRARQTADRFAAELGLPVETAAELTEQDLGVYTGMSYDDLALESGYEHDRTRRWDWTPERGESYRDVYDRIVPFLTKTIFEHWRGSILLVTHAVTMRLIRAFLENTAPRYPEKIAGNGELWQIELLAAGAPHRIETHDLLGVSRTDAHTRGRP